MVTDQRKHSVKTWDRAHAVCARPPVGVCRARL